MLDYILWSISEYNVNTMVQNYAFSTYISLYQKYHIITICYYCIDKLQLYY